ncbi:MAG: XRE family transcriptional regulator [Mycobacteriaceae bacterium]|nr:XRE family transcriptional regulator [Mycobacteriaceae bacterium]
MTLAADRRGDPGLRRAARPVPSESEAPFDRRPVEFWPTSAIRAAVESGDLATWQRITVALKRDPFGRTARQIEEVLQDAPSYGISEALAEVLARARAHLEAEERAEVAQHVRALLERSGLSPPEFASRIGASVDELTSYLDAAVSPSASQMVRMRRLSDRFAKIRAQRAARGE